MEFKNNPPDSEDAARAMERLCNFAENLEALYSKGSPEGAAFATYQARKYFDWARNRAKTTFGAGVLCVFAILIVNNLAFTHIMNYILNLQDYLERLNDSSKPEKN